MPLNLSRLDYKYILYDEEGNLSFETVGNRSIDMRPFAGRDIIIEDDGWNSLNRGEVLITIVSANNSPAK